MMELKRFNAVGGNEPPVFDARAGNVGVGGERKEGSGENRGGIWSV